VYAFALRHASAYNLTGAGHPSLVAKTFCFAPRAKLLSVTVVLSLRPRQPFSLPRWVPRCTRAASSHVRSSHRPTSPPTNPFSAPAPLELSIGTFGAAPKPVGINSTCLPTHRPTRSGSRWIPYTEPTTPQPHHYPHLIEPRQILWILCGCPTTKAPHCHSAASRSRSDRDRLWQPHLQPCGQPLVHGSAYSYLRGSHVSLKS
jgi:hypothetical protein